jgi:putative nucleotidyltransferase with HDIG domain
MQETTGLPIGILDVDALPALPQTLVELIDACNRKDININKLGKTVAKDMSISARVLQLVNSVFIGARATFSDIVQAVIYLGVDTTRNLVISSAVHETFKSTDTFGIINLPDFWHHSLLTAVLAKSLAQETGRADPSEAYLTGLLHDIGKLLLLNRFPDQYRKIVVEQGAEGYELREREILGITHSEAAALLVGRWCLQPEIARAVSCHHCTQEQILQESSLVRVLFCANRLSYFPRPDGAINEQNVRNILNISQERLIACTGDSVDTVREIAEQMGINIGKYSTLEKKVSTSILQAKKTLADRVQTFSRINGLLDNLARAENQERVYRVMEESLQILFNIDRCLFLLSDRNHGELIVRGSAGNPFVQKAEGLRMRPSDGQGFLSDCLEHLITGDSFTFASKIKPGSNEQKLLQILQTEGIMAVPIVIAGHEPGLLIIGLSETDCRGLRQRENILQLFAGHVGIRFRLEKAYQKHAEELAGERIRAVTEMARSIAHEINNPISILQNSLTVLGLKMDGHPELVRDLEIIGKEIDRIGAISSQLQDLSVQSKELLMESVNLSTLISDVVTFFRQALVREHGVDLSMSLQNSLPIVSSNGAKIRQILGNLLKNAIEAIGNKGVIRVTAKTVTSQMGQSQEVMISIEDDGPGVSFSNIDDIFHAGVTTKNEGHAGLGLAIVRKLAAELGSTVICNRKQSGGMIFTLILKV